MGTMRINFAEVEGGFEPVPEDTYEALIEKVEVRESKSSDHDYLNWEFTISEGEHEGQHQWMITSLSPRAMFRLKDVFEALGFDVEDDDFELTWDDEVDITPQSGPLVIEPDLEGMACRIVIKNEVYDGKERNKVDTVLAAGEDPKPAAKKASPKKGGNGGGSKSTTKRRALR